MIGDNKTKKLKQRNLELGASTRISLAVALNVNASTRDPRPFFLNLNVGSWSLAAVGKKFHRETENETGDDVFVSLLPLLKY